MSNFRAGVLEFWAWFPLVAQEYGDLLKNDEGEVVVTDIQARLEELLPNLSWEFGNENEGHSFTLTGEGQISKQLLTDFWLSQSVEIPEWTFFASRQPSSTDDVKGMSIGLGPGKDVDAESVLFETAVNEQNQRIDITAWHPAYAELEKEHHFPILFIFLDATLGEFGTQAQLGEILVEPVTAGANTRSLLEMPEFIDSAFAYHKWDKHSPLESYSAYEMKERSESPRGDTMYGTTCIPNVVFEYIDNEGQLKDDPLADTGAEFAYLAVDGSVFPDGQQVDVRANIEDAVDEALRKQASGRSLGGAFGIEKSYIEFLLFDGDVSRKIIQDTLVELQLDALARLESFV